LFRTTNGQKTILYITLWLYYTKVTAVAIINLDSSLHYLQLHEINLLMFVRLLRNCELPVSLLRKR